MNTGAFLVVITGNIIWGNNVKISYFDQEHSNLNPHDTVIDAVARRFPQMSEASIRKALGAVLLTGENVFKPVSVLSGGERAKLCFCLMALNNGNVLILDEPTAGLDPKERIRIRNFISEIAGDKIVLISTHVVSDIEFIAKEIILLNKGQLVSKDTAINLTKTLEGKVFETDISSSELNEIQRKYRLSNIFHNGDSITVRIVSDTKPENYECRNVKPTLEDLYLYVFEDTF